MTLSSRHRRQSRVMARLLLVEIEREQVHHIIAGPPARQLSENMEQVRVRLDAANFPDHTSCRLCKTALDVPVPVECWPGTRVGRAGQGTVCYLIYGRPAAQFYVSHHFFLQGHLTKMHASSRHLMFHAAIVLIFGLLLGAPYARAIKSKAAAHIVNSWRVAHLSLPIGATLMFAVAALLPWFTVPAPISWVIAIALIISSYGFCVSTPLAALTGQRGLSSESVGLGKLVYLGNMVGALASLVAAVALLYATFMSL
jgi:hypothetical protein